MPEISTLKNAVQGVVKKDKLLNAVFASSKSVVVSFSRVFYAFWLQSTGLLYIFFTLTGVMYLIRQHHHYVDRFHFWVPVIFTLICFCFTVQSFIKAKRTLSKTRR